MKTYLKSRLLSEFEDTKKVYDYLYSIWLDIWDKTENHDDLYSLYVRLQVLAVLLRTAINFKNIKNVNLRMTDKNATESLNTFCNYVIHQVGGAFKDNRRNHLNLGVPLEIYVEADTDNLPRKSFVLGDIISKIGMCLKDWSDNETKSVPPSKETLLLWSKFGLPPHDAE